MNTVCAMYFCIDTSVRKVIHGIVCVDVSRCFADRRTTAAVKNVPIIDCKLMTTMITISILVVHISIGSTKVRICTPLFQNLAALRICRTHGIGCPRRVVTCRNAVTGRCCILKLMVFVVDSRQETSAAKLGCYFFRVGLIVVAKHRPPVLGVALAICIIFAFCFAIGIIQTDRSNVVHCALRPKPGCRPEHRTWNSPCKSCLQNTCLCNRRRRCRRFQCTLDRC